MPEDKAIPAKGIPAPAQFTRTFEKDKKLLQREQKPGVSPASSQPARTSSCCSSALVVIGLIAYGLRMIAGEVGTSPPPRGRPRTSPSSSRVAAAS